MTTPGPRIHPCMIDGCGDPNAPYGFGWPGGLRTRKPTEAILWACAQHREKAEARLQAAVEKTRLRPRATSQANG